VTARLQKVLAAAGLGSRRSCEDLIREGRVTVDGRTATIGMSVDPASQVIRVDGARVKAAAALVYFAAYKPVGVVSSTASQGGKPTILDVVQVPERVFPVGRLDVDSEGLVLLTNDGDLALALTHPRYGHEKEYRVLLDARPSGEQLERWRPR
jgi:23S rRNA pseudouridine2605 synthase